MDGALRERALRLLARREHARAELRRKLAPHAESAEALDALLDDLCARRLLSDARYAEMRVNGRAARYGNARLESELRTQGVDEALVDAALAEADDEMTRAYRVWVRRFGTLPARDDPAERARQIRFLAGRGFSADVIRRIMRGEFESE